MQGAQCEGKNRDVLSIYDCLEFEFSETVYRGEREALYLKKENGDVHVVLHFHRAAYRKSSLMKTAAIFSKKKIAIPTDTSRLRAFIQL